MTKLSDRDLSLEVAKIMWPEYEWSLTTWNTAARNVSHPLTGRGLVEFDHTTDSDLGKGCLYLAKWGEANSDEHNLRTFMADFALVLTTANPHRAIGEAIVETGGSQ